MVTEAHHYYPDLPRIVFGLDFALHSVVRCQAILQHFGRPFNAKDRKPTLSWRLVELEYSVSDAEADAIREFVTNGTPLDKFLCTGGRRKNEGTPDDFDVPQECSVCMDSFKKSFFPREHLAPSCKHDITICVQCVTQSIDTQIPDVIGGQVKCPECPETLPYDQVKIWASPEEFRRYDQNVLFQALRGLPNFNMCLGPGCESGQIHDSGNDQPVMTCNSCSFKTCFRHKIPWHTGQSCKQYDREETKKVQQTQASEKLIAKTAKVCPNPKCGHGITKISGCDHMTCRQCGFEFCYVCRVPWQGKIAHKPPCPYSRK